MYANMYTKKHTHIFIDHTDIDKPIIPLHKIPIKSMYHCKVLSFTVVHRILSTRHKSGAANGFQRVAVPG